MTTHAEIMAANVAIELAEYGEPVTVYPPTGASRSVTAIVTRRLLQVEGNPRGSAVPVSVQLRDSATTGISGAEWNNRFEIAVARHPGGSAVRMRTTRCLGGEAGALLTWEVV